MEYNTLYGINDINWNELESINIYREDLEKSGDMEKLLNGEKTEPINLHLMLLGIDVELDATLQIIRDGETPIVEILGIRQETIN